MAKGFKKRYCFKSIEKLDDNSLKTIESLLKSFHKLQDKYCIHYDYEEAAFGYTEMTNVSMLSTAAIKLGWQSICEYQYLKRSKADGRKNSLGRVDLFIDTNSKEFVCEAKQIGSYSSNLLTRKLVGEKISEVSEDISRSVNARTQKDPVKGLSILFIQHYHSNTSARALNLEEDILQFKKNLLKLAKQNSVSAASYFRPHKPIRNWTENEDLIGLGTLLTLH